MDDKPLLRDPDIEPSDVVIAEALKDSFPVFQSFVSSLPDKNVVPEWKFYNDSKCWLGKCVSKKKTVFWLSAWDGFFRVTFFFAQRLRDDLLGLPITPETKVAIASDDGKRKYLPVVLDITDEAQLADASLLIDFKQTAK